MKLPKISGPSFEDEGKRDEELKETENKISIAKKVAHELDKIKEHVMHKEWDYVCVVAGLPGSGKSTCARGFAKYCCPWFGIDDIVFTAEDFIRRTNECPEFSAVVYDECFEGMNTRAALSPDFQRIVNHLQLIRKRHLFLFLCLPNFFDLSKGIAVFRTSHLWVTYANDDGLRGNVMAFGRNAKRLLYVRGQKFMDYGAWKSNFTTRFMKNSWIVNEEAYEKKKDKVLEGRARELAQKARGDMPSYEKKMSRAMITLMKSGYSRKEVADILGYKYDTLKKALLRYKKKGAFTEEEMKLLDRNQKEPE